MMTEVDLADDLEAWLAEEELEVQAKQDPASVAAESLQRMSVFLGEKTMLACCSELLKSAISSTEWKEQWMGYKFLGMLAEACQKSFKANMSEIAKMACSGLIINNDRIRFEALQCTGFLIDTLSPDFQKKFAGELMPVLCKLMAEEKHLKMQTQAISVMTCFIKGLIDDSAEESEVNKTNKKILLPYAE